jgi:hypothetical protein
MEKNELSLAILNCFKKEYLKGLQKDSKVGSDIKKEIQDSILEARDGCKNINPGNTDVIRALQEIVLEVIFGCMLNMSKKDIKILLEAVEEYYDEVHHPLTLLIIKVIELADWKEIYYGFEKEFVKQKYLKIKNEDLEKENK